MRRAVFLDRDGTLNKTNVINGVPHPPNSLEELVFIPGVHSAIKIISGKGYIPIIVTNQPDVARGKISIEIVNTINSIVSSNLGIKHIYTCFHDGIDNCNCRKPKPGLLLQAALELEIDLSKSLMIGDRALDVQAGYSAGCSSYLIKNNYNEAIPQVPHRVVESLLDFVNSNWEVYEN